MPLCDECLYEYIRIRQRLLALEVYFVVASYCFQALKNQHFYLTVLPDSFQNYRRNDLKILEFFLSVEGKRANDLHLNLMASDLERRNSSLLEPSQHLLLVEVQLVIALLRKILKLPRKIKSEKLFAISIIVMTTILKKIKM